MRFVLETARKDLRRRLADPLALALWIGIPLVLGGLLGTISSGGGTPTARLLVTDLDDSLLSGFLIGAGSQGQLAEFLDLEQVELERGRERLDGGDASALLIIPEGFGEAVLRQEPTELTLITNPAQQILPRIIEEGLDMLVEAAFYAQRLLGDELRTIADMGRTDGREPTLAEVTALATAIYERIDGLEGVLFPEPVIRLVEEPAAGPEPLERDERPASIVGLFLPAMLFMAVLFVAQGMSDDLWQESRHGTLRRLLASPHGAGTILAGKLLAGMVVTGAVGVVALALAWWQVGVAPTRLLPGLLWLIFTGGVLLTYFYALQSLATSQRGGNILTTLVLFPVMMLGGSFFPFDAMPGWMASIGRWTPNGLALVQLEEILWGNPGPASLGAAAGIGLPAAAAFLLCARRLRTGPVGSA